MFTLGRFGSIKTNSGVVSLIKCKCCHSYFGAHQTIGQKPIFSGKIVKKGKKLVKIQGMHLAQYKAVLDVR